MTAHRQMFDPIGLTTRRWAAAAMFAVGLHLAGVSLALVDWRPIEEEEDTAGSITIELAPVAAVSPIDRPDAALGPLMDEAAPATQAAKRTPEVIDQEAPRVDPSPAPEPEVALPKPTPVAEEKPPEQEQQEATPQSNTPPQVAAPLTAAPAKIEAEQGTKTVAPQQGTSPVPARVQASWHKSLLTHLNQFKRYPSAARTRGDQGVVGVQFTLDRGGRVMTARITASSGSSVLDQEALSVLQRASPLPAPPARLDENGLLLNLPIHFRMR